MKNRPKILVTNDDGIFAPGIFALWEAMTEIGDVTVVAPDTEKSAVGHAITLIDPIRVQEVRRKDGFVGFAVKGTPADCVKIAIRSLMESTPDIVISGINSGANVGNDIIYSGTVSAATEGTILGIPSIAISLSAFKNRDWASPMVVAKTVVKKVIANGLPLGTLLNVNVPNIPIESIKGYKITTQGNSVFRDHFEKREDPRGRTYYWMTGRVVVDSDKSTDSYAIQNDYISITPIHYQLTEESFLKTLKNWEF